MTVALILFCTFSIYFVYIAFVLLFFFCWGVAREVTLTKGLVFLHGQLRWNVGSLRPFLIVSVSAVGIIHRFFKFSALES